ncbi:response regulator [Sphingomonas baiyangensis]|uniref:Response regulator n=1 Tax=Sphingomonas baiyangensis TaxID=2572576 RepID=A0A4U1L3V5_9SPHN|nr:response regulator [Sphingomonas baiyangensis]TKD51591.1 response regulator [Sphingomonas baiyangensis]
MADRKKGSTKLRQSSDPIMPRILIIEDDEALRGELVELFGALGATAIGVRDGAGAEAACCEQAFDLVLCDYKLERENGLDVLRGLARCAPHALEADIYLMTGHLDLTRAAREEIACSTKGLLMKPVRAAMLRQLVAASLDRAC